MHPAPAIRKETAEDIPSIRAIVHAAFGTAGAADAQVRTVQGVASMTPLLVDGSATTQPVSAASLPLPSGAATSANQDGIVKDGTGDTTQANVSGGRVQVDPSGVTSPISAASLPLPSGAATSANQAYLDPCQREAKIRISISQTGNTQLITGTASERVYICSIHLVTATAQSVALVSGTGTTCATSTSGVVGFGGASAATGWGFAANGGLVQSAAGFAYGNTDTDADNVCLFQSGAGQVSGGLTYVSAASGL